MEDFSDYGIDVSSGSGQRKMRCPKCQTSRTKHRNDKPLSVDLTKGLWKCHHCGDKGIVKDERYQAYNDMRARRQAFQPRQQKVYKPCTYQPEPEQTPSEKMLAYFKGRGISEETVKKHKIEIREAYMPQSNKRENVIAFPYFRDGVVVNVKYRSKEKGFRMETDCEPIFYGLDDITAEDPVIIVEGEFDKLSLDECGLRGCISVPNGTGTALDAALSSVESHFEKATKFILAGDMDVPGRRQTKELATRLGPEKCWIVEWPEDCKDANDTLTTHGQEVVRKCISEARSVPLEGVYEIDSLKEGVYDLYELGIPQGVLPGWVAVDALYRPRLGEVTYVTGIPGAGKSAFVSALIVNLATLHDWQFMVYPAEGLPLAQYAAQLVAIKAGEPFEESHYRKRMSLQTLIEGMSWLDEHFVLVNPEDEHRTVDGMLQLARQQIFRRGVKGIVIDPWNELSHNLTDGQSEVSYLNEKLGQIRQFARTHQVHVWIVCHPTKLYLQEGQFPPPTIYDISGGAAWANKADAILCLHRNKDDLYGKTQLLIQKIRFKFGGRLGRAELFFDTETGRYSESPPTE